MDETSPSPGSIQDQAERAVEALPVAYQERSPATLLVDLDASTVVYANRLATELAPGLPLPVPLGEWSRAAGLQTADGRPLEDGLSSLRGVAEGDPSRGLQVSAERASGTTAAREALWIVGVPLTDAPGPLAQQALVLLLPARETDEVLAVQELGDDLHARAAMASQLSFTISDPSRPDNPLIWVNRAFEEVTGYSSAEVLGTNCRFLQGSGTDRAVVKHIRDSLQAGITVADTLLNYRKDGTPFWNQVVISPVRDALGTVTHHVGIQADVTARVEAQKSRDALLDEARVSAGRLQLLAEVSQVLAQHLDYGDAVGALADLVVPRLATWGFVAVTSDRGRLERLHVTAGDAARRSDARALEREDVSWLLRSPAFHAALTASASHVAEPFPVDVAGLPERTTPSQLAILERLGLGSAIAVPLWARDRVLGVLCLVVADAAGFRNEDVITVAHVGHRAGLGLDNVRLYQREQDAALTLQRSLLPSVPDVPGLDISTAYVPALNRSAVGGDWFDVLPLPDGALGLAVGDVVGHDLRAAASMGQLRSVLRSFAWAGEPAGGVVARLDELVQGLEMADVATCVYLRLEADRLHYSRAGHPPPLVRLPGGQVRALDGGLRTPVGIPALEDHRVEAEAELPPGSTLVVYTDGLVERRDRTLKDGIAALEATLSALPEGLPAQETRDRLVAALVERDQEDDVCLLVVRRLPEPGQD